MSLEHAMHVQEFLRTRAFSPEERRMLQGFLEWKGGSYEIIAPPDLCRIQPDVLSVDRQMLELSLSARNFSEFPMYEEVTDALFGIGIGVRRGFFASGALYLETSLSFEQIVEDGSDAIEGALGNIADKIGAKIYLRLCDSQPAKEVAYFKQNVQISDVKGGAEYTSACIQAMIGSGSIDYLNEELWVSVPPGRGSAVAEFIENLGRRAGVHVLERGGLPIEGPLKDYRGDHRPVLRQLPSFISAALGLSPEDKEAAVRPEDFFRRLDGSIERPIASDLSAGEISKKTFWATGFNSGLHDDAWSIEREGAEWIISLARPDPSLMIPEGGVLDTAAKLIGRSLYRRSGGLLVPLLPLGLMREALSLSSFEPRSSEVLQIRLSKDAEILDVDLELSRVQINYCVPAGDRFPLDSADELLRALERRYSLPAGDLVSADVVLRFLVKLSQEAACIFAESNGLPLLYQHQALRSRADRMNSLAHLNKQIEPELFREIYHNIEDEVYLCQLLKESPFKVRDTLESMLCSSISYSPIRPKSSAPWGETVLGAFGPPLRNYAFLATVTAWSRFMRGMPIGEIDLGDQRTVLRDILLVGEYNRKQWREDVVEWRIKDRMVFFPEINGSPGIPLEPPGKGTLIKGISLESGSLVIE